MTNKQVEKIRSELIEDLKSSSNLKVVKSIKDIKDLTTEQFKILLEITKKIKEVK